MKRFVSVSLLVVICFLIAAAGLADSPAPAVKCYNGVFKGAYDKKTGVYSYKGIPYAKPPVGALRWKAPVAPDASDKVFDATRFGSMALQRGGSPEKGGPNPDGQSEDCLSLNVWTSDVNKKGKPVMFWIHGGSFCFGGTSNPLYDGSRIVAEHPEVVVVTANYRLGALGFIDLSGVPGGEKYPTSGYNGILDIAQALKWVKQNISAFGGDPDNVTIFGESAGGAIVMDLFIAMGDQGLFRRAISQSGTPVLSFTHESFEGIGLAEMLLEKAGVDSMDDLKDVGEDEMRRIFFDDSGDGVSLSDIIVMPLRGKDSIIPEDPYKAVLEGAGKDVDLLIGSNADEMRLFIDSLVAPQLRTLTGEERKQMERYKMFIFGITVVGVCVDMLLDGCTPQERAAVREFLSLHDDYEIWKRTAFVNEYVFRAPAIRLAYNHAKAGGRGKTYMYYFCKRSNVYSWLGACHGFEIPFVFHNLDADGFWGTADKPLADQMCGAWTAFAASGDPTYNGVEWPEYTPGKRKTMFFNDDSTASVVSDPMPKERKLIQPLLHHYLPF